MLSFVIALSEINNLSQKPNQPKLYKVRYWSCYNGEYSDGNLDNGAGYLILPNVLEIKLDKGKLQIIDSNQQIL